MEPTDLIKTIQSHLDSVLTPPVQVNAEGSRPVPAVLIDSWDTEDMELHNSKYLYSDYDNQGNETARYYHAVYDLRVSFLSRHDSAFEASTLNDKLRKELLKLETDPQRMSDEVGRINMGGGGGVNYQFAYPTETEMTQSAKFLAATSWKRTNFDTIDSVQFVYDITL